ncbi:AI-2E family transporter [Paenibacillus sp.]|uniref:AI-2E family transporter n=1 Tax=Paenibacillus sp. TaxID=58172 RepID=UPI002810FAE1|nr:AI-2E family transporter [Paenibacillus sp.]
MEQWVRSKWFAALVFALLSLGVVYMILLIGPAIAAVFGFLKTVLLPFVVALIVSYVLNPIVGALNRRKVPRTIAVLLIYAVFILSVTVVLMNVIPMFVKQLNELNEHLPEFTMRAQSMIVEMNRNDFLPEGVRMGINNALYEAEQQLAASIADVIGRLGATVGALFVAFVIPFLAFYMLKDFQLIEKTVLTFVPTNHKRRTIRLVTDIDKALGNYIRGQLIVCVIIGVLAYVGYWLIGVPYPLLLAALVALFNIIPYLGPFIGAAPALVVASTVSLKMVMLVIVVNFACQLIESNIVSPQVVGRSLHMHPLLIIFALLVGGELGGVVGLILAVPTFAVGKVIYHHVRLYYKNRKPVT